MMWRIFGPWMNENACECRTIYNEVLNYTYCTPKIFRLIKSSRIKWAGHEACMGEWRALYRAGGGGIKGNVPLWSLKRRRKNSIKIYFQEVRCSGMT